MPCIRPCFRGKGVWCHSGHYRKSNGTFWVDVGFLWQCMVVYLNVTSERDEHCHCHCHCHFRFQVGGVKNDTGKLRQELMNQISLRDFESKGFLSSSQANIQVAELMRSLLNTKWVSASKYSHLPSGFWKQKWLAVTAASK